jgi:hypothetical protein
MKFKDRLVSIAEQKLHNEYLNERRSVYVYEQ